MPKPEPTSSTRRASPTREDIKTLVAELSPKPVNILMTHNTGLTVADSAGLGVRRISVGSSLSRAAWTAFIHAAETIAKEGSFSGFDDLVPYAEINSFFRDATSPAPQS